MMQMVVQRELRAAARKSGSYWTRVLAGGFAALALLQATGNVRNGRGLFFTAVTLAFIVCVFEGVRRASASVATEKAEGTLELLFLTPLTGPELLRGKFAAIAISAFQMALAAVPMLAASLLLGGISAGEFLRALIGLAHILALVISIGIRWSVKAADGDKAMTGTLLFLLFSAAFLGGFALSMPLLRPINPMTPLISIPDGEFRRASVAFFISIGLWQAFAWVSLRTLGDRLVANIKSQQEEILRMTTRLVIEDWPKEVRHLVPSRVNKSPRWFEGNAMEWFTLRDMGFHKSRAWIIVVGLGLSFWGIVFPPFGVLVAILSVAGLAVTLCIAAARSMARLKQAGALELLLTTPLGERGILEGHRRGLHKVFFWPFAISVLLVIGLFMRFGGDDESFYVSLLVGAGILFLAWMTPWFAAAAALHTKTPQRAVGWTIFFVLLLPRLFFCWLGDAVYFVVVGLCVRDHVLKNFRRLVAERFTR